MAGDILSLGAKQYERDQAKKAEAFLLRAGLQRLYVNAIIPTNGGRWGKKTT